MTGKTWVTVEKAAELLGVSCSEIEELIGTEGFHAVFVAGFALIRLDQLEERIRKERGNE